MNFSSNKNPYHFTVGNAVLGVPHIKRTVRGDGPYDKFAIVSKKEPPEGGPQEKREKE